MFLNPKNSIVRDMLLAVIISAVTIIIIFKFTNTSTTYQALFSIDVKFVILAVLLQSLSWVFWSLRIQLLAKLVSHKVSFKLAMQTTLASLFVASLAPSTVGGEPVRMKMLADDGMSYGSALTVVLAERLLDSLLFLAALATCLLLTNFVFGFGLEIGAFFLVLIILLMIFLWELIKRPDRISRLFGWVRRKRGSGKTIDLIEKQTWLFRQADIDLLKGSRREMPAMAAVTVTIWACEFLIPSVLLVGLDQGPSFLYSITAQIIITLISLLPLTPGSSGIAEFSMSYIYGKFVPVYLLGVLVALWRLITYFMGLIVGAVYVVIWLKGFVRRPGQ
jgi:uncharacterized protein (TIRG00374 family)